MFNKNKFNFKIKGKFDEEREALFDVTLEGKGDSEAIMNALVLAVSSFAIECESTEKELISAIKETFKELKTKGDK